MKNIKAKVVYSVDVSIEVPDDDEQVVDKILDAAYHQFESFEIQPEIVWRSDRSV
jgi:hypothetical protein